jgi:dolichyl-diphosphooligosaccharide--protein glycosyltransferase
MSRGGRWTAGALVFGLAVGLRLAVAFGGRATAIEDGRVVIRDPDACYHLRRAGIIADRFPDFALFDSYMNHPRGAHVIWPPLYDLVLAGALRVFPAEPPGTSAAVALLPPLLFASAVLVLFRLAWALWPNRPGFAILAALTPALLPASLPYTGFGLLDHHAAELLMTAIVVAAIGGALARGEEDTVPPWRAAWGLGLAMAGALLTQLSLVVLLAFAPLCALFAARGLRSRALATMAWALALAALLVLPWGLLYARGGAPFRHYQFGLFQPALAAAAALGTAVISALAGRHPKRIWIAIGCALPLLALALLLGNEIAGGFGYVGRSAPWLASIGESQPLFAAGGAAGVRELLIQLSVLALLLPVAWLRILRGGGHDPRRRTILLASMLFAILGLAQRRFLPHLSLFIGFGAAIALEPLLVRSPRRPIRPVFAALTAIALAAAFLPCIAALRREEEPVIAFDRARPVLDYLRTRTPPTSHFDHPRAPGEYGVLAEWSFGHFIQYYGQRPAVTDNFGDHAGDPLRPREFFLATQEEKALALTDSLRVRYILVRDLAAGFEGLIPDAETYRRFVARAVPQGVDRGRIEFAPAIEPTLLYRLAWRYGSGFPGAGGFVPPVAHLRLVAESQALEPVSGGGEVPYVKLYEIVPGAKLEIAGLEPNEDGVFLSAVRSPTGRRFPFVMLLQADPAGTIAVTIPYPTTAAEEGESWIDEGEIRIGRETGRRLPLPAITNADVESGRRIAVGDSLGAGSAAIGTR